MKIADTRDELSVFYPNVVLRVGLPMEDWKYHPLNMGEGTEVQPTWVVWACTQYQNITEEHGIAIVENARHMVLLGNDFCYMIQFFVDQQGLCVSLNKELKGAGLASTMSPFFGQEVSEPVKPVVGISAASE